MERASSTTFKTKVRSRVFARDLTLEIPDSTIEAVNLDPFLQFWSSHNQTIIQVLIVLTLIFIVALVFITLFGTKESDVAGTAGTVALPADFEKSLQKILETQISAKSAVFDFSKGQASDPQMQGQGPALTAEAAAEVEKAKAQIEEKDKLIEELKDRLTKAVAMANATPLNVDASGLEARIKELEARLAEYDIISEDIADLSRFKDENEKLKAQLEKSKTEGQPPPAAPAAAPAASAPPAPPAAPAAPPAQAAPAASSASIDDDLMKEFAAAVEGQKAAQAPSDTPPAVPASPENEDLMGQFENFVQKKEGAS